jgi:hypothetical protein
MREYITSMDLMHAAADDEEALRSEQVFNPVLQVRHACCDVACVDVRVRVRVRVCSTSISACSIARCIQVRARASGVSTCANC